MKLPLSVIRIGITASYWLAGAVLAQTGQGSLTEGSRYRLAHLTGDLEIDCEAQDTTASAHFNCNLALLVPAQSSRFRVSGTTAAKRVVLTATHGDGSRIQAESLMDRRRGESIFAFNLWPQEEPCDPPLLAYGENRIQYDLYLANGQLEATGSFVVTVETGEPREYSCRPGRMYSDSPRDCSGRGRRQCTQYFQYEDYCGSAL